jgi:hypothetical protein
MELAARLGFDHHTWKSALALRVLIEIRWLLPDGFTIGRIAVAAAERTGEPDALARAHRVLGGACWRAGHYAEARHHLSRSSKYFASLRGMPRPLLRQRPRFRLCLLWIVVPGIVFVLMPNAHPGVCLEPTCREYNCSTRVGHSGVRADVP